MGDTRRAVWHHPGHRVRGFPSGRIFAARVRLVSHANPGCSYDQLRHRHCLQEAAGCFIGVEQAFRQWPDHQLRASGHSKDVQRCFPISNNRANAVHASVLHNQSVHPAGVDLFLLSDHHVDLLRVELKAELQAINSVEIVHGQTRFANKPDNRVPAEHQDREVILVDSALPEDDPGKPKRRAGVLPEELSHLLRVRDQRVGVPEVYHHHCFHCLHWIRPFD